jgi:hypothetical protein
MSIFCVVILHVLYQVVVIVYINKWKSWFFIKIYALTLVIVIVYDNKWKSGFLFPEIKPISLGVFHSWHCEQSFVELFCGLHIFFSSPTLFWINNKVIANIIKGHNSNKNYWTGKCRHYAQLDLSFLLNLDEIALVVSEKYQDEFYGGRTDRWTDRWHRSDPYMSPLLCRGHT